MDVNRIGIVSANYGGYDDDACFQRDGVTTVGKLPIEDMHPRMAAKRIKMLQVGFKLEPHDYVIWIDANMQLKLPAPRFKVELARLCGDHPLAVWAHPDRDDVLDEAIASKILAPEKYEHLPLLDQVAHYHEEGLPKPSHLYAGGLIVWNLQHPLTADIAKQWLDECERWSYQDQLSLPYVLWKLDATPKVLPYNLRANPWVTIGGHLRND